MNTNEDSISNDSIRNKRRFVTIGIGTKLERNQASHK